MKTLKYYQYTSTKGIVKDLLQSADVESDG